MASLTLLCLIFAITGYASGFLYEISTSRKELNFLHEETLEIKCSFNLHHSHHDTKLQSVDEMHIVRKDKSKKWTELAKLHSDGDIWKLNGDFKARGRIGSSVNDTYLDLSWKVATTEELGMYRCDVVGKDENFDYDIHKSNLLTVFKHNVTTEELLDLSQNQLDNLQLEFDKFKKITVKKIAKLQKTVQGLKKEREHKDDTTKDDVVDVDKLKDYIIKSIFANVSSKVESLLCNRVSSCLMRDSYFNQANNNLTGSFVNPKVTKTDRSTPGKDVSESSNNVTTLKTPTATASFEDVTTPEIHKTSDTFTAVTTSETPKTTISRGNVTTPKKPKTTEPNTDNTSPKIPQTTASPDNVKTTEVTQTTASSDVITTTDAAETTSSAYDVKTTEATQTTPPTPNVTSTTPVSLTTILKTPASPQSQEMAWPDGRFALMNTASGCPSSSLSPNWKTGYNKYHTESVDENHDNVTTPNHFALPVQEVDRFGNHFLCMHFCVNFNQNPLEQWPKGSYCINMVGSRCPVGFQQGYVDVDEEDDNFAGQHAGVLPAMLYYCCRKDGSPDQPIPLPSTKPFYLYRFGGKCQEVKRMTVIEERMLFDTENENNEDVFENENHPDGKTNDLEINTCYYS